MSASISFASTVLSPNHLMPKDSNYICIVHTQFTLIKYVPFEALKGNIYLKFSSIRVVIDKLKGKGGKDKMYVSHVFVQNFQFVYYWSRFQFC